MSPWFVKVIVLVSALAVVIIPVAVHRRGSAAKVVRSRKGPRERVLLTLMALGFFLPLLWVATPMLRFADYSLQPVAFVVGLCCLAAGLWFLFRSHADLGSSWSMSLEVREKHALVTHGVYRLVRHPMYVALLLYSLGLALVLPNWIAGPAYLVAVTLLLAFRIGPEERMMLEQFGNDYEAYMRRTKRFVPGVW